MALLETNWRTAQVTGARRGGDDHRRTGAVVLKAAGTSQAEAFTAHAIALGYVGSDGTPYTDTLSAELLPLVWTPDTLPPTDPHWQDPLTHTLAVHNTLRDAHSANWRYFCPAQYGGTIAAYFAARCCDFDGAVTSLEALTPAAVPANTAGDVLRLIYETAHFPRPSQGGCNACGGGVANLRLQLIAGTPPLNTATPKVPQAPDHVPDDGVAATTAQIYPPQSLYRDNTNKLLYIGCDQGVRVVDATGQIATVLGTNDPTHPGSDTATAPLGHHMLHASALAQFADGSLLAASDSGTLDLSFSVVPSYQVDSRDANHCLVNLHAATDDAVQNHQGLITVTTPGGIGASASVQSDYFTVSSWINTNPPGGLYPFSEAYTTGLAITSTGRILQAYSALHNWLYLSGDGNPFRASGALGRITDRSATPNVDLVWAYNEYQGNPNTPVVCSGNNGFDLRDPQGIWLKDDNTLLIAAAGNRAILSLDLTTNVVTVVPGTDGTVGTPTGVCLDSAGNIVVADLAGHCIRRVVGTVVSVIAGIENHGGCSQWSTSTNAIIPGTELQLGPARTTQLLRPRSVFPLAGCGIAIADTGNNRVLALSCAKVKN